MIKFRCKCGQKIGVQEKYAGKKCKCPKCSSIVDVPSLPVLENAQDTHSTEDYSGALSGGSNGTNSAVTEESLNTTPENLDVVPDTLKDSENESYDLSENLTKSCPYCGEEVLEVAKKCKHCGEFFNKCDSPNLTEPNNYVIGGAGTTNEQCKRKATVFKCISSVLEVSFFICVTLVIIACFNSERILKTIWDHNDNKQEKKEELVSEQEDRKFVEYYAEVQKCLNDIQVRVCQGDISYVELEHLSLQLKSEIKTAKGRITITTHSDDIKQAEKAADKYYEAAQEWANYIEFRKYIMGEQHKKERDSALQSAGWAADNFLSAYKDASDK